MGVESSTTPLTLLFLPFYFENYPKSLYLCRWHITKIQFFRGGLATRKTRFFSSFMLVFCLFLPVVEGTSKGIPTKMWTSYTPPSTLPSSYATRSVPNVQIQRQSTRFGDAVFSSQSSRNNFTVTTDIGDAEFEL
ncbi:hypothetical protein ACP275_12G062500 [Erythranthe tilingii]